MGFIIIIVIFFYFFFSFTAGRIVTICWQTSKSFTRDLFLMQIYRNANRRMIQLYASLLKPINIIYLRVWPIIIRYKGNKNKMRFELISYQYNMCCNTTQFGQTTKNIKYPCTMYIYIYIISACQGHITFYVGTFWVRNVRLFNIRFNETVDFALTTCLPLQRRGN